jgi:hypothetical protein
MSTTMLHPAGLARFAELAIWMDDNTLGEPQWVTTRNGDFKVSVRVRDFDAWTAALGTTAFRHESTTGAVLFARGLIAGVQVRVIANATLPNVPAIYRQQEIPCAACGCSPDDHMDCDDLGCAGCVTCTTYTFNPDALCGHCEGKGGDPMSGAECNHCEGKGWTQ